MKKSDIYEVVIKTLGLFMLIFLIDQSFSAYEVFVNLFNYFSGQESIVRSRGRGSIVFLDLQNFLATLVLAWVLIFRTRWLVKRICRPADFEENARLFADKEVIYELSIRISGFILLIRSLPEFSLELKAHMRSTYDGLPGYYDFVWEYLISIILGIILILCARSIASLFRDKKPEELEEHTKVL